MSENKEVEIKLKKVEVEETEEERLAREKAEFEEEIKSYKKATMYSDYEDELGDSFYDGDLPDIPIKKMDNFQMSGPVQASQINFGGSVFNTPITDDVLSKANPDFSPVNRFDYRPELEPEIAGRKIARSIMSLIRVPLVLLTLLVIINVFFSLGLDNMFAFLNKFVVIVWLVYFLVKIFITMIEAREQRGN